MNPSRLDPLARAWRRLWLRLARSLAPRTGVGALPDWDAGERRVLCLQGGDVAEMLAASGVIHAIAEARPWLRVDVLAPPAPASVLRGDPALRRVMTWHPTRPWTWPALFRVLRRERYDAVIDCSAGAPALGTLVAMLAMRAPTRVGLAGRELDFAYTLPVYGIGAHATQRLAALGRPLGAAADARLRVRLMDDECVQGERRWRLAARPGRARLLVTLPPRAHAAWPDDHAASLLDALRTRFPDLALLLTAPTRQAPHAAEIARRARVPFAPTECVREALALVAAADAVLCADPATALAASVFARPAVVALPRGEAAQWMPLAPGSRALEGGDPGAATAMVASIFSAVESLVAPLLLSRGAGDSVLGPVRAGGRRAAGPWPDLPRGLTLPDGDDTPLQGDAGPGA